MNAKEWYDKRYRKVKTLRGEYKVKIPDIVSLLVDLREAGLTQEDLTGKNFAIKATEANVLRFLFLKYIKSPRISEKKEQGAILVEDLLEDQADSTEIARIIFSAWTSDPKKIATFFRDLTRDVETINRLSSSTLQETSNRNSSSKAKSLRRNRSKRKIPKRNTRVYD